MRVALPFAALALLAAPAVADEPKENEKEAKETEAPAAAQPKDEEKICRYVRMDMSSRRKERVCLTKEGWVEFNQGN